MAGRVPERPRSVSALSVADVDDVATKRALVAINDAVVKLQANRERATATTDLIIGTNVIRHGLGRPVVGYTLTATTAAAAFAHAIDTTNPNPALELWVTVIGSAQLGARVEIW